jgi:hypothetical protein
MPLLEIDSCNEDATKVSARLAFEFTFEEEVSVVFKGFGGKNRRRLVFAPAEGRDCDDVEIVVSNLEADDLLGVPVEERYGDSADPDFSIYYKLVDFPEYLSGSFLRDYAPRVLVRARSGAGKG